MEDKSDRPLIRKVLLRLIPFCVVCYILNYLDRVNISIARVNMMEPASGVEWFSERVFANGAAIFFLGYFLFELPSNLIQQRVGPRRWIARIMITWGLISMAFMFVHGAGSFYSLRFLLGLAEAGFFPGVLLYFSYWVPRQYHARATAIFLTSTAIAGVIGNPLGGFILYVTQKHADTFANYHLTLAPWQWLFLLEGAPTVIVGVFTLFYLTDKPSEARWLSAGERERLTAIMSREQADHPASHLSDLRHAFFSPHTWMLSLMYGLSVYGFYTVNFYTPTIIKEALRAAHTLTEQTPRHIEYLYVGLLSAIPFTAAAIGMVLIGGHSDRRDERKFHAAFACTLTALGLAMAGIAPRVAAGHVATALTIGGLSIGAMGVFGIFGPFWSMPGQLMTGTALAGSIAIINSVGNLLGGFLGPQAFDKLGRQNAMLAAAGLGLCAAVMAGFAPVRPGFITEARRIGAELRN